MVSGADLLRKLGTIPIQTWNYRAQDAAIRHMGPTAQDFSAAFGLGEDAQHISTVDADGVALAGVQALYRAVQDQQEQIRRLRADIERLKARLDAEAGRK